MTTKNFNMVIDTIIDNINEDVKNKFESSAKQRNMTLEEYASFLDIPQNEIGNGASLKTFVKVMSAAGYVMDMQTLEEANFPLDMFHLDEEEEHEDDNISQ